jgi:enoyl-CoA hydratase
MSEVLQGERRGSVEVVTVCRPEKRNALNLAVVRALHDVLDRLEVDPELRAVVITGAGGHFMAGADIAELRERGAAEALASINGSLFRRMEELPVPLIAAVRGYALGGGCELALACDLRVAGRSARFGQPEVGLGILPGAGATYRLPGLVGLGRAKDMIFTGRIVDAEEAARIGLVDRLTEDDAVLEFALDLAGGIASQGAQAVRLAKLALSAQRLGHGTGQVVERVAQAVLFDSEDKRRRMTAFLERVRGAGPRSGD